LFAKGNSPAFDKLVDNARKLRDDAQRKALYVQAEDLMAVKDAAVIPLAWASVASLTKPYVKRTFAPNQVESYWKWDIQK
jgi:ABC-type oligopeptide transport system substrate-binding subunit